MEGRKKRTDTMKYCYIVFLLLFFSGASQAQNILDSLELTPSIEIEQMILTNFKKLNCYEEGINYKIQPIYYLNLKHTKGASVFYIEDSILTNEALFKNDLYSNSSFIDNMVESYVIYNDSLHLVGYYSYTAFCAYKSSYYDVRQYAMENQYIIFEVSNIPANMMLGYKDRKLYVLEQKLGDTTVKAFPFEEFDWKQPYIVEWRNVWASLLSQTDCSSNNYAWFKNKKKTEQIPIDNGSLVAISAISTGMMQAGYGIKITLENAETGEQFTSKSLSILGYSPHSTIQNIPPGKYFMRKIAVPVGNMTYFNCSKNLQSFFGEIEIKPNSKYYLGNFSGTRKIGRVNVLTIRINDPSIPESLQKKIEKNPNWKEGEFIKLYPYEKEEFLVY